MAMYNMSMELLVILLLLFFFGASITSFFLVYIERRDNGMPIVLSRSKCNFCGKNLSIIALIPFFHYFLLRGQSDCCGEKLRISPPIFEAIGGAICIFLFFKFNFSIKTVLFISLFLYLYFLSLQDLMDMSVYYFDLFLLLMVNLYIAYESFGGIYIYPIISTSLFFLMLFYFANGKFGFGDVLFCILLSFLHQSVLQVFYTFMYGFVIAAIYGVYLLLFRNARIASSLPLIPFISLGYFIHFLYIY